MKLFGGKKDDEPEAGKDTGKRQADPAAWALPPDAAVAVGAPGVPAPPEPSARVAEVPPPVPDPPPGPEPAPTPAVPAPQPLRPVPAPAPAYEPPPAAALTIPFVTPELAEERPEILVAGAFVGAFLFARILKRISE